MANAPDAALASGHMFAGTIVASNYIEMAQLLGESFLGHHPASRFAILVIDDEAVDHLADGLEILRLSDLDLSVAELDLMKTIYDVMELSTAVKPALLRTLLRSADTVCYLDPDIYVYSAFDDAIVAVETAGIVLTPHVLQPVPRDGLAISEQAVMESGMFNLGFIAVGPSATPFLDWWMERLLTDAVVDLDRHLFTDQKWVDWVPALFDHHVSRDPGMNIAWWNIHERHLELGDSHPAVNGQPVRFIHYSGYDPVLPDVLSKHQVSRPRVSHALGTPIRELADDYGRALIERSHVERRTGAYQWAKTVSGLPLTSTMRRLCRDAALDKLRTADTIDELGLPTVFGTDDREFRRWLNEPTGGSAEHPLTRLERSVWEERRDLQSAFPNVDDNDAANFHMWLSVEDDAIEHLGEFAPPRRPRPAALTMTARIRARCASAGRRGVQLLRSRV
jgi:hypothetical protein